MKYMKFSSPHALLSSFAFYEMIQPLYQMFASVNSDFWQEKVKDKFLSSERSCELFICSDFTLTRNLNCFSKEERHFQQCYIQHIFVLLKTCVSFSFRKKNRLLDQFSDSSIDYLSRYEINKTLGKQYGTYFFKVTDTLSLKICCTLTEDMFVEFIALIIS